MEIFKNFFDAGGGGDMLGRWAHILFGVTWIGLLYFFNVVQVPAFAEMEAGSRSEALRKVTWRALWWFRWAAFLTFLTGVWLLGVNKLGEHFFDQPRGTAIFIGALLATTMFVNVWGVIWRNQKINIGSANAVAAGGAADRRAADAAKKAARASRINTFFSIPMLFFMVFSAHYSSNYADKNLAGAWVIAVVIWAVMELSALGYLGGLDNPINKAILDDHKRTIWAGFVYLLIILIVGFEMIIGGVS